MSSELVKQPIIWVENNEQLERYCASWRDNALLAFDTEFMRSRTYYPIAGLIQVNDGTQNYLIDPTSISDFYPLVEILDDENILKVLHSCSEDLEVFQHAFGCLPQHIFDTQIAASMTGFGYSIGFGRLVHAALGVELPKSETRSDWLQRPLSQSQLRYAAIDVEYLFIIAKSLMAMLEDSDRLTWALEDSNTLVRNFFDNQDPDKTYLRFRSAWKLNEQQLAILKGLCRWREDLAQDKNVPRNRILKEAAMYSISQKAPEHIAQLRSFEGMTERMVRNNGENIIKIVERVKNTPDESLPARLPKPLNTGERDLLDILKQKTADIALSLSVPNELLVRKKDYEEIIVSKRIGDAKLPATLKGWRKSIIGDVLTDIADEY